MSLRMTVEEICRMCGISGGPAGGVGNTLGARLAMALCPSGKTHEDRMASVLSIRVHETPQQRAEREAEEARQVLVAQARAWFASTVKAGVSEQTVHIEDGGAQ